MEKISRRRFLRMAGGLAALTAGGSAATLLGGCTTGQQATATPTAVPPVATTVRGTASATAPVMVPTTMAGAGFVPDIEIALKATRGEVRILPGQPTRVWMYQAQLLKGDPATLQPLENTYLGPIIRVRKGQKVRVHLTNDLPEQTIVHWHGVLVPSRMDGHPRDVIAPGKTYVYEYEVVNRSGTYWYHPHPHTLTGGQAYRGLAGLFLISDDEEAAARLPAGQYDVPLVIQDRTFDKNNQLADLQNGGMGGMSGMMTMDRMMGFLGDRILVNGQPDFVLPVTTRAYRLRLLNGSNSRVYKLAWSDGAPLTVIATDGGLLEKPVQRKYLTLGPAERVELWADFSKYPVGTELTLRSLEFVGAEGDALLGGGTGASMGSGAPTPGSGNNDMGHGGMGGMDSMGGTPGAGGMSRAVPGMGNYNPALPNGAAFPVLKVRIERQEQESLSLPATLSTVTRYRLEDAVNGQNPRSFGLSMRGMQWLLNGRTFQMEEVADNEVVKLNTVEAWQFVNEQNPGQPMEQMGMVHPMHIHGVQFQVIDRQATVPQVKAGWDSVREGYVDEGFKDTVLVMPGERVKLLMKFTHPDLFVYHCHNLEHEDLGMMRNYRVER